MYQAFQKHLQQEISDIRAAGLYKNERVITSPQDALIKIADGREMLNLWHVIGAFYLWYARSA